MKDFGLLSIIIPVYNSEKWLKRCTDNSARILESYKKDDFRIKVYHQKNVGQGITRKRGIDYSTGEYIAFVDNDDYIRPRMYETMISLIHEKDVDICVCLWNYETENGYQSVKPEEYKHLVGKYHSFDFAHLFFTENSYEAGIVGSPWNKVYKKHVLNNVISTGKIGEDEEMLDCILTKGYKIYVDENDFYVWCYHETSMSHKGFTKDYLHRLDINYNRIKLYSNDAWIIHQSALRFCNLCIEYYYKMKTLGLKFPPSYIYKLFKLNNNLLIKKKYKSGFKFHIRMFIFLISPFIYEKLILHK